MKRSLLNRLDFDNDEEYYLYLERQQLTNSVEYWDLIDPSIGEALNEYRNDKESYQFDTW